MLGWMDRRWKRESAPLNYLSLSRGGLVFVGWFCYGKKVREGNLLRFLSVLADQPDVSLDKSAMLLGQLTSLSMALLVLLGSAWRHILRQNTPS